MKSADGWMNRPGPESDKIGLLGPRIGSIGRESGGVSIRQIPALRESRQNRDSLSACGRRFTFDLACCHSRLVRVGVPE